MGFFHFPVPYSPEKNHSNQSCRWNYLWVSCRIFLRQTKWLQSVLPLEFISLFSHQIIITCPQSRNNKLNHWSKKSSEKSPNFSEPSPSVGYPQASPPGTRTTAWSCRCGRREHWPGPMWRSTAAGWSDWRWFASAKWGTRGLGNGWGMEKLKFRKHMNENVCEEFTAHWWWFWW